MYYCIFGSAFIFIVATQAITAPQVYRVDEPSPVHSFIFRDIGPALPSIVMSGDIYAPGGGSGVLQLSPAFQKGDEYNDPEPYVLYDIEAADIQRGNANSEPYQTFAEYVIDDQLSPWIIPLPTFDYHRNALPPIYSSHVDNCTSCSVASSSLSDGRVRYLPFRWRDIPKVPADDSGWHYGWLAMRGDTTPNPDPDCIIGGCPKMEITLGFYEYLGFAVESETDIPIITGGGLCPAGLNFDARTDFFDVSLFLDLYTSGDLLADFAGADL